MNVVYSMSSETMRAAVVSDLSRRGYVTAHVPAANAYPFSIRVRQVDEADEAAVVQLILDVDPAAVERIPKPSFVYD